MAISDRDIYATALQLVKRYGERASFEASLKADEHIGDPAGLAVWKRILAAIAALTANPGAGSLPH